MQTLDRTLWPAARLIRRSVAVWRRSLHLRVVLSTLLLSALVTVFVGWILLRQVTDGVLDAKVAASVGEASAGFRTAQSAIDAAEPSGDPSELTTQLAQDIALRGASGGLYDVVLDVLPAVGGSQTVSRSTRATVLPTSVPSDLRAQVRGDKVAYRYTLIRRASGNDVPGLAVGSQLHEPRSGATLNVYYLFDLQQQEETLNLLRRSLVAVGVLIVVLLGCVAWFVTRQVVTPVRLARQVAERLAAGLLDQRMRVRGQDDLARLATSFNQMASSLQRQIRRLEELSRVQRRFVSDVSHELRTPLTTVRMAADVLYEARQDFEPGVARACELLQAELDRFEALLGDLLEISRFDAGAAALELEDLDLRGLVRRVVDGARPIAARKGSRIDLHLPQAPAIAEVDSRRIERVLRNLVINALEYGEGRDVVVRVGGDDETTAVSVRDYGIGLKPGESAMVFERFWRADPARARTTGGTGLGLAIALEDVLLHGGWLQAWGEPGRGAHFRLTLPRTVGEALTHSPIPLVPGGTTEQRLERPRVSAPGAAAGGVG
ncbi:MtrAB system histidine kinase MtrB [Actinopolymorpha pittospori]|uniref:Sensor histidine kinase MtrB n=1 Tax=Actinopolymorpha pittospori TaxID=648752 RepID=A0A927N3C8_9ACTN|nr:MtrAB system histidine kinase MtrB [Actinopolymorpha pittospori]MBE1607840.1 two-component system sensor histidine kinase MtrB [Actinopolymorpha pittospori]